MSDSRRSKMTPQKLEIDGHEYVDLGLPSGLKWATMNVGAYTPYQYGSYFSPNTYKNGDVWDSKWRRPTESQLNELLSYTDKKDTMIYGKKYAKFINKTDSSKYILVPSSGFYSSSGSYSSRESFGYLQSSTSTNNANRIFRILTISNSCNIEGEERNLSDGTAYIMGYNTYSSGDKYPVRCVHS